MYNGGYTFMPSDMRFTEVCRMLESAGFELVRIRGSHHVFAKEGASPVSIPVHNGLVKYGYVRRIQKIIETEQAAQERDAAGEVGEAGEVQHGDLEGGPQDGG